MAEKNEARYAKPASQVDLEERFKNENRSKRVLSTSDSYREQVDDGKAREFAVEDNDLSEYVGTDPVYQTYANKVDKPLRAESGIEKDLIESFLDGLEPAPERPSQGELDEKDEERPSVGETGDTGEATTSAVTPAAKKSPEQGTDKVKSKG